MPDITVEIRRSGERPELYPFDPTYKLVGQFEEGEPADGRPTKVDIHKMNAYRGAIRDEQGEGVVISAATLYPGPSVEYGRGIEAIQSDPAQVEHLEAQVSHLLQWAISESDPGKF